MKGFLSFVLVVLCIVILPETVLLADNGEPDAGLVKSVEAVGYAEKTIYHSPETPGYTAWAGLWQLPDGRLRCGFLQLTGSRDNMKSVSPNMESVDGGETWKMLPLPPTDHETGRGMAVLSDGTLVRPLRHGVLRSEDGGKTWGPSINLLPPERYFMDFSLVRPLRDGRLVGFAGCWKRDDVELKTLKPYPDSRLRKTMFISSDKGKTWGHPIELMSIKDGVCGESDFCELPNGDLFWVHRCEIYNDGGPPGAHLQIRPIPGTPEELAEISPLAARMAIDPSSPFYRSYSDRKQSIARKKGDTFVPEKPELMKGVPHSGYPMVLYTQEGSILSFQRDGIWSTADLGKHWEKLKINLSKKAKTSWYPKALQLADGKIICISHVGADDEYGTVDQSIIQQTFRLQSVWKTSTFQDFSQGRLADGGANTYISADGAVRLSNLWDFNGDGNFDIPVTCPQDHNETPNLFIYASGKQGYSAERRTELPGAGSVAGASADLNADGFLDLVVCNWFDGEKNNLDSYIYWGSKDGFNASRRTGLPTEAAIGVAVADLNRDGHPDIVFANQGVDYHMTVDRRQESFVYWGSKEGYRPADRLELKTINANDVAIADLNRDNNPDIVFAMEGNEEKESGALIYFGNGKGGFNEKPSVHLPGIYSSGVTIADLNADGRFELILTNKRRLGKKPDPPTGDVVLTNAVNSFIYWGGEKGYSARRRTELPTHSGAGSAVEDLNRDGLPDIVFANVNGESSIYWNSPKGFTAENQTWLETHSAADCKIADLNGDGYPDLVIAQAAMVASRGEDTSTAKRSPAEPEYTSGIGDQARIENANTDSCIYWGGEGGFSAERRTQLPTQGAREVVLADFDQDGGMDIVFLNKVEGRYGGVDYFVYWGDDEGRFSAERRASLPMISAPDAFVNADLNGDGYADLFYPSSPALIYWGGQDGLSPDRTATFDLPHSGYTADSADVDRDGFLDLILSGDKVFIMYGGPEGFSSDKYQVLDLKGTEASRFIQTADLNGDGWTEIVCTAKDCVVICWNSPRGFHQDRSVVLRTAHPCNVRIADLNRDEQLDIVVISESDPYTSPPPGRRPLHHGDPYTDMRIFWGSDEGYSSQRFQPLPTVGTDDFTIADLNGDRWLDIAVASYHSGDHRHHPGYIYWNGPEGFDSARRDLVPMNSGCGIFAADIDYDGRNDLVFANHVIPPGDHRSYVSVLYGNEDGLVHAKPAKLPALGPHYFNCRDVGNVYDRAGRYDYISAPFDGGTGVRFRRLTWEAETPFRTGIEFQIRTATTRAGLENSPWSGPGGVNDVFRESGAEIGPVPAEHRWIQYKAALISPNCANSPVLRRVDIGL